MTLLIQPDFSIKEVQSEFSKVFPYLKLEFFKKMHSPLEGTEKKHQLNPDEKLNSINKSLTSYSLHITENTTVTELEQKFQNELGLPVQIFRKSGNSWLETTITDAWSLSKQNDTGAYMSQKIAE